jgi:hypothetical protein
MSLLKTENWSCKVVPGENGGSIECTHTFGAQETMKLTLPWWGAEVNKIPYSKEYGLRSIGAKSIREPADLDIEITEPKKMLKQIAQARNYLDPKVGKQMDGKEQLIVKADSIAIGVETGSSPP